MDKPIKQKYQFVLEAKNPPRSQKPPMDVFFLIDHDPPQYGQAHQAKVSVCFGGEKPPKEPETPNGRVFSHRPRPSTIWTSPSSKSISLFWRRKTPQGARNPQWTCFFSSTTTLHNMDKPIKQKYQFVLEAKNPPRSQKP